MKSCDLSDIELLLLELTGKKEEKQALSTVCCLFRGETQRWQINTPYSRIEKTSIIRHAKSEEAKGPPKDKVLEIVECIMI